jgi:hypothetical protein
MKAFGLVFSKTKPLNYDSISLWVLSDEFLFIIILSSDFLSVAVFSSLIK